LEALRRVDLCACSYRHSADARIDLVPRAARLHGALVDGDAAETPSMLASKRSCSGAETTSLSFARSARTSVSRSWRRERARATLLEFQSNDETLLQRAAGFLAQWFADGLVTRISLSA
jgi:hypothetical protein